MEYVFWISLCVIIYTYLGYPFLVYLLNSLFKKPKRSYPEHFPNITILIPCFNEQDFVKQKIENLLSVDYPADKLEIVFVTDGSTDDTNEIISSYIPNQRSKIKLSYSPERKGKQHAVNRVMPELNGDIIVFNDCNTTINSDFLQFMIPHFTNPEVGVVTGEKKIIVKEKDEVVSSGEGMYWKYECWLKQLDSDFHSTIGSPGELFAVRKELYRPVPESISIEDFYLSMSITTDGFKNIYESRAVASELSSASLEDELIRKRRIASGAYRTILQYTDIYKFKHLKLLFLYISHRVLRWTLAPISLVVVLVSNAFLIGQSPLYNLFFSLQILFYTLALLGWLFHKTKTRIFAFYIPFYFIFMNLGLYLGFLDFLRGKRNVIWKKAKRKTN